MFKYITRSKKAKQFFSDCGIRIIKESSINTVVLQNKATKEELRLWAESDHSGIPGIFIDVPEGED